MGHRFPGTWTATLVVVAVALGASAAPADAQYADTSLVVDPGRVPYGTVFSGTGLGCSVHAPVDIGIVGIAGVLVTVSPADDGSFVFGPVDLPAETIPGVDYTVRADCRNADGTPLTLSAAITVVCPDGTDPVSGICPGATTPTTTPPTTTLSQVTTTVPISNTSEGPLAHTGAGRALVLTRAGITLVALGGILVALGRRRDRERRSVTV